MILLSLDISGVYENIVWINECKFVNKISEDTVDEVLKYSRGVGEPESHD